MQNLDAAINKARSIVPEGSEILMLTLHGSRLYGTDTPESDIDIKGIYLPPLKEVVLSSFARQVGYKTKKDKDQKNTADDWDIQMFSLQSFLDMCIEGETIAIDMLHSDNFDHCLIDSSDEWEYILQHRSRFYTKNMKAFLGYVKKQAARYGFKGSRMSVLENIVEVLKTVG